MISFCKANYTWRVFSLNRSFWYASCNKFQHLQFSNQICLETSCSTLSKCDQRRQFNCQSNHTFSFNQKRLINNNKQLSTPSINFLNILNSDISFLNHQKRCYVNHASTKHDNTGVSYHGQRCHIYTSTSCAASGNVGPRSAGMNVFDRHTKLMQRERAASRPDASVFDYLKDEVGYRMSDRIFDIKQQFDVGLDLGCGRGHLSKNITDASLKKLYMSEFSPGLLASASVPDSPGLSVEKMCVDEEAPLPFETNQLDVVLSNLNLHWVNNLPGCLREVHRCLKPDGAILASMFGGDTLYELRSSLLLAEMEREGGMSAHVSPFTEVQDIGSLLTNAGFSMLTIDTEDITVGYPTVFELLWDLQGMAENNASVSRKLHLPRETLMAAAALYQEMYGTDEGVPATFQIIYMIGWKSNPGRMVEAAPRGSGQVSLKDLGRLEELMKERGMEGKVEFIEELIKNTKDSDGDNKGGK